MVIVGRSGLLELERDVVESRLLFLFSTICSS